MSSFRLDIVSVGASLYSGDARFVVVPGESGELGICPRHIPLFTTIRPGVVTITEATNDAPHRLLVAGGVLEVARDGVTLVVDHALRSAELDAARADTARRAARDWRMRHADQRPTTFDFAAARADLMDEIRRFFALAMQRDSGVR
ncbi:ATP synthase F1 subunit epsilon [Paraburkholderia phosphatilytica]|uniref:ATP synthase F1 subunit epsilon n=1 Tax=Paraburkholderia phosphatilytica TaxID=2282883 RepID=UPI000E48DC47|nr:ATP synthase F1 subunit epsilon [Paraburkholderia phosphatilytica]